MNTGIFEAGRARGGGVGRDRAPGVVAVGQEDHRRGTVTVRRAVGLDLIEREGEPVPDHGALASLQGRQGGLHRGQVRRRGDDHARLARERDQPHGEPFRDRVEELDDGALRGIQPGRRHVVAIHRVRHVEGEDPPFPAGRPARAGTARGRGGCTPLRRPAGRTASVAATWGRLRRRPSPPVCRRCPGSDRRRRRARRRGSARAGAGNPCRVTVPDGRGAAAEGRRPSAELGPVGRPGGPHPGALARREREHAGIHRCSP